MGRPTDSAPGPAFVENIRRDLRYALRSLRRNAGFSFIAIIALALGIGASAAIYSIARTVVMNPLPFPNASRLVQIETESRKTGELTDWTPYADIVDWQARNRNFKEIAAYTFAILDIPGNPPAALYGARVTYNLMPALGVAPAMGRNFLPGEDEPGHAQEVILSDVLWRSAFGADPTIVGKSVRLLGQAGDQFVVVGVMPAGFNFPLTIPTAVNPPTRQMAYWIPVGQRPTQRDASPTFISIGLLRADASLASAQGDLSAIAGQLEHEYPNTNTGRAVRVVPLKSKLLGRSNVGLILLLAAIAAVLLLVCLNLANLLVARSLSRSRESGVRLALGASRSRLIQQWLTETFLLAAFGGIGAMVVAKATLQFLLRIAPQSIPRIAEVHMDSRVFLFVCIVSLIAAFLVGNAPAFSAAGTDVQSSLSGASGTRTTANRGQARFRDALIVAEVSIAVALTLGASLLVKSFLRLTAVDPGFSRNHVEMALVLLVNRSYPDLASRVRFMHKLVDELKTTSGIVSAGAVDGTPLSGNLTGVYVSVNGQSSVERGENRLSAEVFSASADYLSAIGIGLLRGRYLTEHDANNPVVLVNQRAAETFWPNQDPIGQRISVDDGSTRVERYVVGMVTNTHDASIDQPVRPALYIPMEQAIAPPQMVVVRTNPEMPQAATARLIRNAVAAIDKEQPVFLVTSMEDLYENSIADRRFTTSILTGLGALAFALAALGIYGLISYVAVQRTRELGIRAALGARKLQMMGIVVRESMILAMLGIVIGLTAGLMLTRYISSLLYNVASNDMATVAGVIAAFVCVSLLAGAIPSYRAASVDPLEALRND